jgi:hypothetical protein
MCNALVPILQDVVSNLDTVSVDGSLHGEVIEPASPAGTAMSMKQYYDSEFCYVYGLMTLVFFIFFNIFMDVLMHALMYVCGISSGRHKDACRRHPVAAESLLDFLTLLLEDTF